MNMNCQGPCLLHCYNKNSILLLLIGFIIGSFITYVYYFYWNKPKNENKTESFLIQKKVKNIYI